MMEYSPALETDWVLIQSAGKGESEDYLLILSGGGASQAETRAISGTRALMAALRLLAPRRVVLDFQVSFRHGLRLLRALKRASPEVKLLARLRSLRSICSMPLYFSVDVRNSGAVSLHRVGVCGHGDDFPGSSAGGHPSMRRIPICACNGIEP